MFPKEQTADQKTSVSKSNPEIKTKEQQER